MTVKELIEMLTEYAKIDPNASVVWDFNNGPFGYALEPQDVTWYEADDTWSIDDDTKGMVYLHLKDYD